MDSVALQEQAGGDAKAGDIDTTPLYHEIVKLLEALDTDDMDKRTQGFKAFQNKRKEIEDKAVKQRQSQVCGS